MSDAPKMETWENVTRGRVVVCRFDRNGEVRRDMVRGGQKFTIKPEDRELNSDRAANEKQDVFKNGTLSPVRLIDDRDDPAYREIASNPNLLSEGDLRDMFGLHWKTFEKKLQDIDNPRTLARLLDISNEEGIKVTVNQQNAIKARLEEVDPAQVVEAAASVEQLGHIRRTSEETPSGVTPQ